VEPACGGHAAGGAPRPGLSLYLGGVGAEQEQQQEQNVAEQTQDGSGVLYDAPLDGGKSSCAPH
jgi:hypothetical protein